MKNLLLITALLLFSLNAAGQSKNHKYGVTAGGYIQHYNGNLGNSFFQFKTTCFAGVTGNFGIYLTKSLDVNLGGSLGQFGYCQTRADENRAVALAHKCPGCKDKLGMGSLRSLMLAGNMSLTYKFANDILLEENSKIAPYVYAGIGINRLYDNMKRQCVNVGTHVTLNAGAGIKYNINEKINVSYKLGMGRFITQKVYATNTISDSSMNDAEMLKMEKRKDMYMQNTLMLGINFN